MKHKISNDNFFYSLTATYVQLSAFKSVT